MPCTFGPCGDRRSESAATTVVWIVLFGLMCCAFCVPFFFQRHTHVALDNDVDLAYVTGQTHTSEPPLQHPC